MKRFVFFLFLALIFTSFANAQNRAYSRGADPGELYINAPWYGIYDQMYGPPFYETLRMTIYHITENGKKLTIQYDADYFANPETTMVQGYIPADATPGVLYAKCFYYKNSYPHTSLWVSFDYGKNWTFREENEGNQFYYSSNFEGVIYRGGDGSFKSNDYANTWNLLHNYGTTLNAESLFDESEFIAITTEVYYNIRLLYHTHDFFLTATEISIDEEFVFGLSHGFHPDVYRGGKEGEIYISSWFPDNTYKISFSADTGYTFRHVYVSDVYPPGATFYPHFMSDREPGSFYIFQCYEIPDNDPLGWHIKICIDYYRDYGETLEATFCHDLTKEYEYEEVICEHITSLDATTNQNSIQLQWSNTADNIRGYHVYRNNTRITNAMLTNTTYLDENLPNGVYKYYVRAYYESGCVSDSSNHIIERIGDETCEPVDDLIAEKINDNSILLTWSEPESDLQIEKYNVFRNNIELANHVTTTSYLDENLPSSSYEYYVIAHYTNGCVSDSSNHVKEMVGVGIVETDNYPSLRVYPNPTTGELIVEGKDAINRVSTMTITNIEIFDVFGRTRHHVETDNYPSLQSTIRINISHLPTGVYFMQITTDKNVIIKKIIKY